MFLKVIREDVNSKRYESLYECKRIHTHWPKKGEGVLNFILESDNNSTTTVVIDGPGKIIVYVMNGEGKTIERIIHEEQIKEQFKTAKSGLNKGSI